MLEQGYRGTQALVVAGLLGQVAEGTGQACGQETQPAGFRGEPKQGLGHGQGEQFSIGQPGWPPTPGGLTQVVVDLDVECREKGVQVGRHKLILNTLLPSPATTPT